MALKQESFERLLEIGAEGEHLVGKKLMERGVILLPLYQFINHENAPLIFSAHWKAVAPDLTCFKDGVVWFTEVKTKRRWVKYKGRIETGLDGRSFNRYKRIKCATELRVYLFFNHIEKDPIGIYYAEIDQFTRFWDGKFKGEKRYDPMYFYNYGILGKL